MHPVLIHIGALLIPSYGAVAAAGLLLALMLAQRTARMTGVSPAQVWNLCVLSLFAALVGSRLLLMAVNWRELVHHPLWVFGLGRVHHPLVGAAAALVGVLAAAAYARRQHMPPANTADALAAPIALGLAFEQLGALLVGAGFGTATSVRWAVTYTHPLASRWSGAPIGVPVHPVQAYAALGWLALSVLLVVVLPARRQVGDVAGIALMGAGVVVYLSEIWRDWEGRGTLFHAAVDGPQAAAIVMVLAGALVLRERKDSPVRPRAAGGDAHD